MRFGELLPRIAFVLVVGLFITTNIRLAKIKPHTCDEIFSFYHSKGGDYSEFFVQTKTGFNRMPPLYFLILKILFPESNFIYNTRLLSLFFSLITTLFLYKISRLWLDPEFSLCISVCGLFGSNSFIEASIDARPYSLCLLILTIFIYTILNYEIRARNKNINKYILFFLCTILPFCHYLYGITAFFLGLAHVLINTGKKWEVFKIYLCSGIIFVVFHLMLFLEQQQFGNLLAIIAFPTFERLTSYLVGFLSLDFLLIVVFFSTFVYYLEKKTPFSIQNSTISLLQISCALSLVFIIGVLIARMFPSSLWFLPRYYIGTVLIVPLVIIFIFSLIRNRIFNYRKYFFLICAFVCIYTVLDSYNHRKYFFENTQLHSYQSTPPDEIVNSQLPLYTKDIILFAHYLYAGKPIHYINSDSNLLHRIGLFFPSSQNYLVQEIKNTPCILLNIGHDIPELNDGLISSEMEVNIGPIHTAFHLRDF